MNKIMLYIPFDISSIPINKGSSVRINSMIENFIIYAKEKNYEALIIQGNQNERYKNLMKVNFKDVLFIYIEFPNIPLLFSNPSHIPTKPFVDYLLFKKAIKNKIPIGGFLRDIYWKFDDMYPFKGMKKRMMSFLNERHLDFYSKYLDILYLPSLEMAKHLNQKFKRIEALPSGGNPIEKFETFYQRESEKIRGIYVGSLHESANIKNFISAAALLKDEDGIEIILVCRKSEYDNLSDEYKGLIQNNKFLILKHLEKKELDSIYYSCDFAIIPYEPNVYNNFAMPVKLIEYFSRGLPILSTNTTEVANFILKNDIGEVVDGYNEFSLYQGMLDIKYKLENNYFDRNKIYTVFLQNHTWLKRIEKIENTLVGK